MPKKRSHGDFSRDEAGGHGSSKRSRAADGEASDPIDILIDSADELLDCIRSLKSQRERGAVDLQSVEPKTKKSLALLSRRLSPALQILGGDEEPHQPRKHDAEPSEKPPRTGKPALNHAITISPASSITEWHLSDIPTEKPPIPAVLNPALEAAALTHSGLGSGASNENYERLEWIGDAYLYLISSSLIYQTFKTLRPGRCAQIREVLVRNSTLAGYSTRYDLDKRLRWPAEFGKKGREGGTAAKEKERNKVLGDVFEAYVGAIILSDPDQGVGRAAAWLKALWAGTIANNIREEKKKESSSLSGASIGALDKTATEIPPKTVLAKLVLVPGVRLRYEDTENEKKSYGDKLQRFSIALYLEGWGETKKLLGKGTALSKKDAGQMAAQRALEDKALIQPFIDKKAAFVAAQAASTGSE